MYVGKSYMALILLVAALPLILSGCCNKGPYSRPLPLSEAKAICEYRGYTHIENQLSCLITSENCGDCEEVTEEYCANVIGGKTTFKVQDEQGTCILSLD